MAEMTNSANVHDWLEATKEMIITAYVETVPVELVHESQPFTKDDFEQALRKVSQRRTSQSGRESS
jgi:hypothetical protein